MKRPSGPRKSMKDRKLILSILGFVLASTIAATAAEAPKLTFAFTTANVPGAVQTRPGGINNAGVVVGQYLAKNGFSYGYILNGKKLTKLDHPNGTATVANGLNLNGTVMVVGQYGARGGTSAGFLYKSGKFTDIPGPKGATFSAAYGINDHGSSSELTSTQVTSRMVFC